MAVLTKAERETLRERGWVRLNLGSMRAGGLSLDEAVKLANATGAKARETETNPMCVAVLDAAATIKSVRTEADIEAAGLERKL